MTTSETDADVDALRRELLVLERRYASLKLDHDKNSERLLILRERRDALMVLRDDLTILVHEQKEELATFRRMVVAVLAPAMQRYHVAPSVLAELTPEGALLIAVQLLTSRAETDPVLRVAGAR